MAKKKEKKETKVVLERTYIVPLRKGWIKAPMYRRTKKALTTLREFIQRHMKAQHIEDIKVGKYLNLELWKHGIRNPPHKIKVVAKKNEEGLVKVELFGAPEEKPAEKAEKKAKKEEAKKAEEAPKEEKAEKAKEIEKEEIKELKKEHPKVHHPPKQEIQPKMVEPHPSAPMSR